MIVPRTTISKRIAPPRRRGVLFAGLLCELMLVLLLTGGIIVAVALVSGRSLTTELFNPSAGTSASAERSDSRFEVVPIYHLSLTRDEQACFLCTQQHEVIHQPLRETGLRRACETVNQAPSVIASSPADETLLVGSIDGSISICRIAAAGDLEPAGTIEEAHQNMVLSLDISPDGRLAASGSNDGQIHLWNVSDLSHRQSFAAPRGLVQCLRFTADGRQLAAACGDHTVRLWDLETSREVQRFTGHDGAVMDFDFLDGGNLLATGSLDRTLRLWDVRSGVETWSSQVYVSPIFAIAASPDGRHVACGDLEGRLRVFDCIAKEFITERDAHPHGVRCLCYRRDGAMLISAGYDGTVCEWDARTMRKSRRF